MPALICGVLICAMFPIRCLPGLLGQPQDIIDSVASLFPDLKLTQTADCTSLRYSTEIPKMEKTYSNTPTQCQFCGKRQRVSK